METSSFNKVFSLQSGLYCHFYGEYIVINDRPLVEKRDLEVDLNKTTDYKKLRLFLNILLTLGIFTMVAVTGFYPLALLVFMTIWDLKNIKRQTLPTLISDCIPLKNISGTKFISGKLGFNQIDLLITNNEGKQMVKVLKVYDSKEETLKAIGIFKELGWMNDNPMDENKTALLNQKSFPISDTESLFVLEKEIAISRGGIYPERSEYVGINNVIFLFVQSLLTTSIFIKIYLMMEKQEFLWADGLVLLLLLLLFPLPFKYFNKSTADLIERDTILKAYTEEKKGKTFLVIEFKSGWLLPLKRKIQFEDAEAAKKALAEIEVK